MTDLFESKEMEGLDAEEQCVKAIGYILKRIKEHPHVGWHCGIGTQSFALLTEAYATLKNMKVEEVRNRRTEMV